MFARQQDPIVAIATAPGRGAVGMVRVSGRGLMPLARALTGRELQPRLATYGPFLDAQGQAIDQGLALFFPAPHSYTGEDVLELQAHGGPVVLQLLLQRCLQAAAATQGGQADHPALIAWAGQQPGLAADPAFIPVLVEQLARAAVQLEAIGEVRGTPALALTMRDLVAWGRTVAEQRLADQQHSEQRLADPDLSPPRS